MHLRRCIFLHRLQKWIAAFRTSDQQPGGVARYIENSPRFRRKIEQRLRGEVVAVVGSLLDIAGRPATEATCNMRAGAFNVHFCMPRFDALVAPLTVMFHPRNLGPILEAISDEATDPTSKCRSWAHSTLDDIF